MIERKPIFDAVGGLVPGIWNIPGTIAGMDAVLDLVPDDDEPATDINARIAMEIIEHEAILLEAYKDSEGVWTWGPGITDASGHLVMRYKDSPQTLEHVLAVYVWLLRTKYLPDVLRAFNGYDLREHELAAALSFHWNTGGIKVADWVRSACEGKRDKAYDEFLNWSKPVSIIPRRKAERALFFDGKWAQDGKATLLEVSKPTYTPRWGSARQVDITAAVERAVTA